MPAASPAGLTTSVVDEGVAAPADAVPEVDEKLSHGEELSALLARDQFRVPCPEFRTDNVCGGGAGPPSGARKIKDDWFNSKCPLGNSTTGTITEVPASLS